MKLTAKQFNDLETIKYFIPSACRDIKILPEDVTMFFEYSERGFHKKYIKQSHFCDGFNALVQGKVWRGRHMEMYEEGALDYSMPYSVILQGMPRIVVDFMKNELFKGMDRDRIEINYKELNK